MGVRRHNKRLLSVSLILAWADLHRRRTGAWPLASSGPVRGAPGENWEAVNKCLRLGLRGLAGGDTLPRLLERERGVGERRGRPEKASQRLRAAQLRALGLTLAEIGRRLGITRQRISQLLQVTADTARRAGRAS